MLIFDSNTKILLCEEKINFRLLFFFNFTSMAIGNQTLINMIKDVQHRLRRFSTGGLKQLLAKRADRAVARRSRRRGWPPVGVARGCPLGVFCELNVHNFRPFFFRSKFTEMYDFLWSQGDSPFHKIMCI